MPKGKQVQQKQSGGPPSALLNKMQSDVAKGTSQKQEDNLVPLIYILQSNSPQVNERNTKYIQGAEENNIWLRNADVPLVDGEEGILFQPCHFDKDWVEWVPRAKGGGFVGRHRECPKEAERVPDQNNPNRIRIMLPNGNEVVETRYHVGFVYRNKKPPMPYVIPMSSTGHTTSRQWMFMMNQKLLPNGGQAPSWACLYKLTTKEKSNASGTWWGWDVQDAGWVETEEQYERGLALYEAFEQGDKSIEEPEQVVEESDAM